MNCFLKLRLASCLKKINSPGHLLPKCFSSAAISNPASSRTFSPHMGSPVRFNNFMLPGSVSFRFNHTGLSPSSGEKDLVEFLQDEIAQEKRSLKMKSLPAELDGFVISTDQAELTFTRKRSAETVTVSMNVNHSVDTEEGGGDGEYVEEMKSKPSFDVEIARGGKTLCFSCSYTQFEESGDKDAEDNFEITEVTFFEGTYQEKTYAVAADLLDENLYDLFMVILNEKGITKKFVEKISEIATSHEHSQYIQLLESVRKFASTN